MRLAFVFIAIILIPELARATQGRSETPAERIKTLSRWVEIPASLRAVVLARDYKKMIVPKPH